MTKTLTCAEKKRFEPPAKRFARLIESKLDELISESKEDKGCHKLSQDVFFML